MIEIFVPRENVNDDTIVVRAVHFVSGTQVNKGQQIVEIETSKTAIDIESPADGVLFHNLEPGEEILVGGRLFSIGTPDSKGIISNSVEQQSMLNSGVIVSKAAEKRAGELGVKLSDFDSGWITASDVERKSGLMGAHLPRLNETPIEKNPDPVTFAVPVKNIAISKRKQSEIKSLQVGNHHATSSTIGIDIKVSGARLVEPPFLFKDSISDLIVFEASRLLRSYPQLNAVYMNSKTVGEYERVNFGWSFDDGSNLKVLAIKDSDKMSLVEIHAEVDRLLDLYESRGPIPTDILITSTVTVSDLSRTDTAFMLPLINGRQSLILGIVSRQKNSFSVFATFDHRISEGLTVSRFLENLKERVLSYYASTIAAVNLKCCACEKPMAEELSLGYRGFTKITLPNGEDDMLCRVCFEGY